MRAFFVHNIFTYVHPKCVKRIAHILIYLRVYIYYFLDLSYYGLSGVSIIFLLLLSYAKFKIEIKTNYLRYYIAIPLSAAEWPIRYPGNVISYAVSRTFTIATPPKPYY